MAETTEGAIDSAVFENVLSLLEEEASKFFFTLSSEANLLRIFSSIYDRAFFFQEISKFPHHGEILIAISASSNYLTDIVVRNPEFLHQLFDQEYLMKKPGYDFFKKEVYDGAARFKSLNAKLNFLRQVKKRFILKIGLADILGFDELISITEQLSYLAKSINAKLFEICYEEILRKYNVQNLPHNYCLCSLGKLGGNELNYSSDVDLILFYDFDELVAGTQKEYYEILSEAVQLFIKSSTEISDRGYIYRVDFRLRPDGKYSPLCKTFNDYAKYYETRGEDWERQMLIKLDYICGSGTLYKQFYNFIQTYIYSSSFSSSIKEKIKLMKLNIERQNKEKENVKTFWGGIRDIEFAVQALQLINGGRIKTIRTGNTLKAISLLHNQKLLSKREKEILTGAYIFYRRIEHFLQLMNDTQTHLIPDESDLLHKLSNYAGFISLKHFREQLKLYRVYVRKIYDGILKSGEPELSGVKFIDVAKSEKNLKYLRSGTGLIERKEFDSRTIDLFTGIEPQLIKYLKTSFNPDKILENFVKVIRSTKFPSIWYSEFTNEKFFMNFLEVCQNSEKAIDLISTNKSLEEFFLSRKVFTKDVENSPGDFQTNEIILIASVQFALGLIGAKKVSKLFTSFIEYKLQQICNDMPLQYKYFVGGLGSFGCENMSFSSDIDLIFVAEDVDLRQDIQKDFQNLLSRAKEELKPFDVDCRLRPEGKSSPLVWGIKNYDCYLQKRARVWEFQSLLKLRFVCSNKNLFEQLRKIVIAKVKQLDKAGTQKEIRKMYSSIQQQTVRSSGSSFNIKKDPGGILTIDFILQSICLNDFSLYKKMIGKSLWQILSLLKRKFSECDFEELKNNYSFLKSTELALQNISNINNSIVPSDDNIRNQLALCLGMKNSSEFDKKIVEVVKSNNNLFTHLIL